MDNTIELAHRVRIETDHRVWGLGCRAVCSCGWASQWTRQSADDALRAGGEHLDAAVGAPDGMKRAMSAMLDLQDDLSAVVMWLAENWSADLPSPAVCSCSCDDSSHPRAGVRLLVYCPSVDVLARAAERLEVPVTRTTNSAQGVRIYGAVRDFGRVRIDAYAAAPEVAA
jgi:hypothetical protein